VATKKRGLGRGLDALLNTTKLDLSSDVLSSSESKENKQSTKHSADGKLHELPIDMIRSGKYQPRIDMNPERLESLANSIKSQGIVQPIVVRPLTEKNTFEVVAGERRWRAAQMAGLDKIPAIIKEIPNESAVVIALIENIQREELNPIEEALAFQRLVDEFDLTHLQVAEAVGRSRTGVTNLLRLLALPDEIKKMLCNGDIEMGHARALLTLPRHDQLEVASIIIGKDLSVRETEKLVRDTLEKTNQQSAKQTPINPDVRKLEEDLAAKLGAQVAIKHRKNGRGKLEISYNNLDELDGILAHIK